MLGRLTEPKKQTIIDISNSVYSLNAHAQMFQERLRECHRPTRKEKLHFKDFETIKEILFQNRFLQKFLKLEFAYHVQLITRHLANNRCYRRCRRRYCW